MSVRTDEYFTRHPLIQNAIDGIAIGYFAAFLLLLACVVPLIVALFYLACARVN